MVDPDSTIESPGTSPVVSVVDGRVELTLDLRVYRLTAIQKAAYRLAASFTAVLGQMAQERLTVTLIFAPGTGRAAIDEGVSHFFREALDQELREKIAAETRPVRALILAQAFSKTDLIRRD